MRASSFTNETRVYPNEHVEMDEARTICEMFKVAAV